MAVRALLVGIDAYTAVQPLRGCVNDMNHLEELLRARVTGTPLHLEKLLDEQATYAGIVEAFRRHLGAAGPGDVAFFAYAGHGSQEPAPRELHVIEPDKRNETLVCVDSRIGGTLDLADKELAALIAGVVANGASVVCLFDCCHSGTITRGGVDRAETPPEPGERRAPAVETVRPFESYLPELRERLERSTTRDADVTGAWAAATAHVVLSACQSEETAKEVSVANTTRGAFSAAFEQALAVEGPEASVRRLARTARARVQQLAVAQHPVVYATVDADLDRSFLGEAAGAGDRSLRLFHRDGAWEVDGGALHGLVAPSGGRAARLAVVEVGQEVRLGEVEVVDVHSTRAVVRPLGGLTLDRSGQYRASIVALPAPLLAVDVVGEGPAAEAAREAIAGSPLLGASAQHVTVRVLDDRYRVEAADGATIVEVDPPDAPRLVGLLEHLARWHAVLALDNPSSPFVGLVDVEWVPVEPGDTTLDQTRPAVRPLERDGGVTIDYLGGPHEWRPASWFLRIVNRSDRPVHAMLLDLTDAYRIHDALFPASSERIPAGGMAAVYGGQPIPFTISGRTLAPGAVGRDWLKLVVSDVPMDSSLVVLPRLGAEGGQRGGTRGGGGSDDLFGGTRDIGDDSAPASGPQWGALTIPVVIRVP